MWVPPEVKDPILWQAPTRKTIGLFGAVRLKEGRLVAQQWEPFNGETFEIFLTHLLRYRLPKKKMIVVLDNSRYHHSRSLKAWLWDHRKFLRLDFLPPYSPQLNPIERVWKLTRKMCVHNRYFSTLNDLIASIENQFISWAKPNECLRRLCAII
jgi:transposase